MTFKDCEPGFPYLWAWGPSAMRILDRKGQRCRVLARGKMNSAMIEFEDGFRVITSRNGLRRANPVKSRMAVKGPRAGLF